MSHIGNWILKREETGVIAYDEQRKRYVHRGRVRRAGSNKQTERQREAAGATARDDEGRGIISFRDQER